MPPTSPVVVPINADEFVTSVDAIHDDSPRGRISSIEGAKRLGKLADYLISGLTM